MTDTSDWLAEARRLCEAATPPPWEWWSGNPWRATAPNHPCRRDGENAPEVLLTRNPNHGFSYREGVDDQAKHDMAFATAARTLLPRALDEIERLRAVLSLAENKEPRP